MTSFAYDLPIGRERNRGVLVQAVAKSIVASPSSVKLVPNKSVRQLAVAMSGKAIARLLVVSVAMAGSPALAAKGLVHHADWYACEQNATPCRLSIFGTCVPNTNCAARVHVLKPMPDDNWPANLILGYAVIRLVA
jgi:hypothetical protein